MELFLRWTQRLGIVAKFRFAEDKTKASLRLNCKEINSNFVRLK